MKVYWDASSLILALLNGEIRPKAGRVRTLAEAFATMTGKGIEQEEDGTRLRIDPADAAELLASADKLKFVELTGADTLQALQEAKKKGIRGGMIHDWLHVRAATKAKADTIATENVRHFSLLTEIPLKNFAG